MDRSRIARAAVIIMLGNLVTSALGFVRQAVTARYFGATGGTDAWFAAYTVPQMFYDLIIGGAIAAALIPSFTRLAEADRQTFWRTVTTIFVMAGIALTLLVAILEAAAHPLMSVIASGFLQGAHHTRTLDNSVNLVRVMLPTLFFWGLSAVSLAALYSIGKRVASSFATSAFHIGIICGAVLLASPLGIVALPIGAVAGAAAQFLVQAPSLFRARREMGAWVGRHVDFRDPAVRRVLILYGPVAAGIVVSIVGQIADINFKSHLPQRGFLSDMQYATTLIQFPVGIVVAALGLAVLPFLSSDAGAGRLDDMKDKLALGFRLVIVLMIPAAIGYELLGHQIIALLFERGRFGAGDVGHTMTALSGYAPQLPFIGIDQLLIFAFYARHNTLTPMLAGIVGVGVYVVAAFILIGPLSILGLALANTIQIALHALLLLILLLRAVGGFRSRMLAETAWKTATASVAMGLTLWGSIHWTQGTLGARSRVLEVVIPMVGAVIVYGFASWVLKIEEVHLAREALRRRLRPV